MREGDLGTTSKKRPFAVFSFHSRMAVSTLMKSRAIQPTITKKRVTLNADGRNAASHRLIGRRVAVPQRFTEVEDDGDGFCFGAIIVAADERRAVLKFDYTGEREAWRLPLVRQWLADDGIDSLSSALDAL